MFKWETFGWDKKAQEILAAVSHSSKSEVQIYSQRLFSLEIIFIVPQWGNSGKPAAKWQAGWNVNSHQDLNNVPSKTMLKRLDTLMIQPSNSQMKQFDLIQWVKILQLDVTSQVCVCECVFATFLIDLKEPSGGT